MSRRLSKSQTSIANAYPQFPTDLLMESVVDPSIRKILQTSGEEAIRSQRLIRDDLIKCNEDRLIKTIIVVQSLTAAALNLGKASLSTTGLLMTMNLLCRVVLYRLANFDNLMTISMKQLLQMRLIFDSSRPVEKISWRRNEWTGNPSESVEDLIHGIPLQLKEIRRQVESGEVKVRSARVRARVKCRVLPPADGYTSGDHMGLLRHLTRCDKRSTPRLLKRSNTSASELSADEEQSGPSSRKYRKMADVRRVVRNKLRKRVLSADEAENLESLVREQAEEAVKNNNVGSKQLFYTDREESSGSSSADDNDANTPTRGCQNLKRPMAAGAEAENAKRIRINDIPTAANPIEGTSRGTATSYPGYCLFRTEERDKVLYVYLSRHTPPRHYHHLEILLGLRARRDNLCCTVPLRSLTPAEVSSVVGFFAPQNPWCRSTYTETRVPHCACCPPFLEWCGRVMDREALRLVSRNMIPWGWSEEGFRSYQNYLEELTRAYERPPTRQPNKYFHCR